MRYIDMGQNTASSPFAIGKVPPSSNDELDNSTMAAALTKGMLQGKIYKDNMTIADEEMKLKHKHAAETEKVNERKFMLNSLQTMINRDAETRLGDESDFRVNDLGPAQIAAQEAARQNSESLVESRGLNDAIAKRRIKKEEDKAAAEISKINAEADYYRSRGEKRNTGDMDPKVVAKIYNDVMAEAQAVEPESWSQSVEEAQQRYKFQQLRAYLDWLDAEFIYDEKGQAVGIKEVRGIREKPEKPMLKIPKGIQGDIQYLPRIG